MVYFYSEIVHEVSMIHIRASENYIF